MRMRVRNRCTANGQLAWCTVDDRIETYFSALQRQGNGKGLERRTRLEGIGHGTVTQLRTRQVLAVVRVIGRPVGEGKNFTGLRVNNDGAAGLRLIFDDGLLQLAVGEVLDLRIKRQTNILAILRRLDRTNILDDLSAPVLDHAATAGTAEQLALVRELDPFQPLVIDAGEANHVCRHFAGRVIAAIFLVLADTGQFQGGEFFGHVRRNLALQENKGLFTGQLACQFLAVQLKQLRQLPALLRRQTGVGRNCPDRFHRCRNGQHVAIAIGNATARG